MSLKQLISFAQNLFLCHEFDWNDSAQHLKAEAKRLTPLQGPRAAIETMSAVTRWREANSNLVGTADDFLNVFVGEAEDALRALEVESKTAAISRPSPLFHLHPKNVEWVGQRI